MGDDGGGGGGGDDDEFDMLHEINPRPAAPAAPIAAGGIGSAPPPTADEGDEDADGSPGRHCHFG